MPTTMRGASGLFKRLANLHHHSEEDGPGDETTPAIQGQQNAPPQYRLRTVLPNFSQQDLERLIREVQDYQIVHGSLLKVVQTNRISPSASCNTVGISLYPSPFPRRLFDEACELQVLFQELYIAISMDPDWLHRVLEDLIRLDPLVKALWSVFESARKHKSRSGRRICMGIFRSDYMMHAGSDSSLQLKQVEFNTTACAGAMHGQRVSDMHRHLCRTGIYDTMLAQKSVSRPSTKTRFDIPSCDNIGGICDMLETAHNVYLHSRRSESSESSYQACILMIVQPRNFNIADERPIEYNLWSRDPPIPCFRVEWGNEMLDYTILTSSGSLVFQSPYLLEKYEVSVAYFRAGFEPREYNEPIGKEARIRFEISNTINCPDILTHLTGSKKVQQVLSMPGEVERFIDPEKAARLRQSFMRMYPLDGSALGAEGKHLATSSDLATRYILKPSRDGGGHNVYRTDIPPFLDRFSEDKWAEYILMEIIRAVIGTNCLASSRGIWLGDVVAELGIWGGCMWQHQSDRMEVLENRQIGWSVRSKTPYVDEMSVVKGYGCFDSIVLIEDETRERPTVNYVSKQV